MIALSTPLQANFFNTW